MDVAVHDATHDAIMTRDLEAEVEALQAKIFSLEASMTQQGQLQSFLLRTSRLKLCRFFRADFALHTEPQLCIRDSGF